jgi:acetate---CoA ligase (ADP-forming)
MWTDDEMRTIGRMLNPRSIAVVGASPRGGYGGRLLNAVLRSKERIAIYPVNPGYEEIHGVRAYPSVAALPEAPDLVCVVVPHHKVLTVLEECRERKAGAAVIISAGFAERGTDSGASLQQELGAYARRSGLRFTGPNCLGLANVREDIWATASSRTLGGLSGHVALVCQSGATAFGPFLLRAVDAGIGLRHIVSTDNEADLDFTDFARWFVDDPATRVIAGFVEGFRNVQKFIAVAELAAERGKPIVLIKIGRSASGAQAARSHTAALTGADDRYDALFRQYGVIRVHDYDELLEVSHLLANSRRPLQPGIAVVSHSGGISSLTADLLGAAGLELPPLSERARTGINAILGDFGWASNPADVTGYARREEFGAIMDHLIAEPAVGTLVVASAGAGHQVDQVIALRERTGKNVVFCWTASRGDTASLPRLKSANVPIFYSPERLAFGLKSLIGYHAWREAWLAEDGSQNRRPTQARERATTALSAEQRQALDRARSLGRTALSESESGPLAAAWGVAFARGRLARSPDEALDAAREIGFPVALKVDSPDIAHKTEAGLVRLNVGDAEELARAYDEILANAKRHAPQAQLNGVLVQEMVMDGVETITGIQWDPQIGPMIAFGSGGVLVEIYRDIALRRCPIDRREALKMINEVRGAELLRGFRGRPAADVEALADTLVHVSHMAVALAGELRELDLNPLLVLPAGRGVKAADALAILRPAAPVEPPALQT